MPKAPYVCHRKCFYNNEFYEVGMFGRGDVSECKHFHKQGEDIPDDEIKKAIHSMRPGELIDYAIEHYGEEAGEDVATSDSKPEMIRKLRVYADKNKESDEIKKAAAARGKGKTLQQVANGTTKKQGGV